MPPLDPVPLSDVLAIAAFNPATMAVAFIMGRKADQPQKLVIAALVAAVAGSALVWLLAEIGIPFFARTGRAAGGILVAQVIVGLAWAALGYGLARRKPR